MLNIRVKPIELFDDDKQEFINIEEQDVLLEHSLVSISKWESKWHKPFISSSKTNEELIDYIRCMIISDNNDKNIYKYLSNENLNEINEYISDSMTATTFFEQNNNSRKEIITSELIYFWMVSFNIPIQCENWHLNRLLTLIRICSIKNTPAKKMSKNEIMSRNAQLNAMRKQTLHTKG